MQLKVLHTDKKQKHKMLKTYNIKYINKNKRTINI